MDYTQVFGQIKQNYFSMKVFEMVERIGYFHSLVMKEVTGSPCKFAERLNISRTNLYNLIEEMRGYGIEIEYSRTKGTFYYKEPYRVKINISIESLSDDELKKY